MPTPPACTTGRCARPSRILRELGLTSAEINAGGFIPAPHLPVDDLLSSGGAREAYLGRSSQAGITLTGLNVNGNPLHPDPEVGPKHAEDLRQAIELAGLLGVRRVVTMSGLPAPHRAAGPWVVNPWDSQYLDVLDYQWQRGRHPVLEGHRRAGRGTPTSRSCIEMHPQNLVFNPGTLERLATEISATHVGAEMDPSHLFWQGIDPVAAIEAPGPPGLPRRREGHPDQRAELPRLRRARRPLPPDPGGPEPGRPRRQEHADPVAGGLLVGLRRRRARPRRGLLGLVPCRRWTRSTRTWR